LAIALITHLGSRAASFPALTGDAKAGSYRFNPSRAVAGRGSDEPVLGKGRELKRQELTSLRGRMLFGGEILLDD